MEIVIDHVPTLVIRGRVSEFFGCVKGVKYAVIAGLRRGEVGRLGATT